MPFSPNSLVLAAGGCQIAVASSIMNFMIGIGARWGRGFSRLNFRRADECDGVLRWLEARAGERILDVGSGDGFYDWRISRTGARVTGIDLHEKRLAFARKHYGSDLAEFLLMDAEKADFPPGSFDKALSLCVMEHLGDDEKVMRNVARALKPGGVFVFSADSLSNAGLRPEERDRHRTRYAVKTFYTPEIVRDKLTRAGFDVEETRFVMDAPLALKLVRVSWKLDDLPASLVPVRTLGYLALGALWKAAGKGRSVGRVGPKAGGLTILVRSKKRAS
jgi:2-polyprenyl-3-methyl-5-hydroxy-6-metoxy-1,4-benzoquinol methylase